VTFGHDVPVAFPRFTARGSIDLHDALTALGIISAFDPLAADLSGIDGRRDLVVGTALHQAMLQVDEHGATAAAATGVGIHDTAAPAPIVVDRPFVFLLYDHVTGAVLFAGRIVDPTRG
jgi:serpin B